MMKVRQGHEELLSQGGTDIKLCTGHWISYFPHRPLSQSRILNVFHGRRFSSAAKTDRNITEQAAEHMGNR